MCCNTHPGPWPLTSILRTARAGSGHVQTHRKPYRSARNKRRISYEQKKQTVSFYFIRSVLHNRVQRVRYVPVLHVPWTKAVYLLWVTAVGRLGLSPAGMLKYKFGRGGSPTRRQLHHPSRHLPSQLPPPPYSCLPILLQPLPMMIFVSPSLWDKTSASGRASVHRKSGLHPRPHSSLCPSLRLVLI